MFSMTSEFLSLFHRRLHWDFVFIIFGSIISGALELFGIMLILPFVQVAMDSSSVANSRWLQYIYETLNLSDYSTMIYIVGFLCGFCFILKDIFMLAFQYFQFKLVTTWRNELSEKFMDLYLGLNYRYHLKQASTAIINTLTSTVSSAVNGYLLQVLFIISYSVVALCLVGYMIYSFFEATFITTVFLFLLMSLQVKFLQYANREVNKDSVVVKESNLSNLKQGIEAIKETKMFLREQYFSERFKVSNRKVTDNERKINIIQYIPLYLTEIAIILGIIILVCSTIYFNEENTNSFGQLAILVAIAFRLTPVINRILTSYSQIKSSTEAVKVLLKEYKNIELNQDCTNNFLDKNPEEIFNESISLSNVYFSYNSVDVLLDINLDIKKGEFVGIVGHSGSGKTTIVDILMGLLKPREGYLLIDGKIAEEENIRSLRKKIGYVPQSPFIGDMSVRQNIAYGYQANDIEDDKIWEVLNTVNLHDFFMAKPEGLDFKLGESGKALSGGQKQRIAIARALYNEPDLIVLDEATSALDVVSENDISKTLMKLKGKTTIVAIAHRLSTIKRADKVVLVNWGRIEDIDSFDNLVNKNKDFEQIVELAKL